MKTLNKLAYIPLMMTCFASYSGSMGPVDTSSIAPGFLVGVEGGIAHVDWPIVGNTSSSNGDVLSQIHSTNSFNGTIGAFLGYKFPISAHISLNPTIAYHYVGTTSNQTTSSILFNQNTAPTASIMKQSNELNIADLTIQANYRLHNGVNFFLQPGMAIVNNSIIFTNTRESALAGRFTNTAFRPQIGLGLGKMVTEHVNFFAKYNFISGNDLNTIFSSITPNISTLNLGLSLEA